MMDDRTKALRQRLKAKAVKKEMEEKKEKARLEMEEKEKARLERKEMEEEKEKARLEKEEEKACLEKEGKKRVDDVLTFDENIIRVYDEEQPKTLDQLTEFHRQETNDPDYESVGWGIRNVYGRTVIIPWAEAKRREENGTLEANQPLNKYGRKSVLKQIRTKRVKTQFCCENCYKVAEGVEPPLKRCGSCSVVAYCSRACQVTHWKKHKHVCAIMKEEGRGSLYLY
jgi:hypothetical protein